MLFGVRLNSQEHRAQGALLQVSPCPGQPLPALRGENRYFGANNWRNIAGDAPR
jgi:hypothetical protein